MTACVDGRSAHHWVIDTPGSWTERLPARCKHCGATRDYDAPVEAYAKMDRTFTVRPRIWVPDKTRWDGGRKRLTW